MDDSLIYHIGVAVLVAAALPTQRTAVLVVAYLVASMLAAMPYIRWRKKYHKAERAEGVGMVDAVGMADVETS